MFSHCFQQGGMGVEVFSSAGKDPGRQWKVSQNIHRVYDRSVKGFVFLLEKGATTNMSIPPAEGKELLGLIQPLLVFQVRLQPGKHFGFDVVVQDDKGNKRRLYFSSTFRDFENHGLHVQVPLAIDALDGWINMIVDLGMLMHLCFRGSHLHSILSISLKPVCRVRRIFTMPYSNSSGTSDGGAINIPAMFDFPAGTEFSNTIIPDESRAMIRAVTVSSHHEDEVPQGIGHHASTSTTNTSTTSTHDIAVAGVHVTPRNASGSVSVKSISQHATPTASSKSDSSGGASSAASTTLPAPPTVGTTTTPVTTTAATTHYHGSVTPPSAPSTSSNNSTNTAVTNTTPSADEEVDVASALRLIKAAAVGASSAASRRPVPKRRGNNEGDTTATTRITTNTSSSPKETIPHAFDEEGAEEDRLDEHIGVINSDYDHNVKQAQDFDESSAVHPTFKSAVADILKGFDPNDTGAFDSNINSNNIQSNIMLASMDPIPPPPSTPDKRDIQYTTTYIPALSSRLEDVPGQNTTAISSPSASSSSSSTRKSKNGIDLETRRSTTLSSEVTSEPYSDISSKQTISIDLGYMKRVLNKLENNYLMDYGHEAFSRIK